MDIGGFSAIEAEAEAFKIFWHKNLHKKLVLTQMAALECFKSILISNDTKSYQKWPNGLNNNCKQGFVKIRWNRFIFKIDVF